jgi:hypothetical protein
MESRTQLHPSAWWMFLAATAVVVRLLSPGILESGDGIWHYQIARWSWTYPHLLLDHWGKPLYTLFASPFAQVGHWGMTLFNALSFVVTCWAADGILRRAGVLARWLYAPALLLVPVHGTMVLAGMTEIFFGMLTLLVLRALADERYTLAAIIASFTPFARPEYVVFLPIVLLWLAWGRHWRALPWLLTGHVIYGAVGALVWGDVLWYFHRDPYIGAAEVYGSGHLLHFWERRTHILGTPALALLALSLPAFAWLWSRRVDERPLLHLLLVVALLPALGIALLHSFLWWKGLKGSLGLERVLATAAPLLVLFAVWAPARVLSCLPVPRIASGILASIIGPGYLWFAITAFQAEQQIPVPRTDHQAFLDRVAQSLTQIPPPEGRYVIFQPYITFSLGLDPFDPARSLASWPGQDFGAQDRLVWDGHFGPNEARLPLDELLADSTMRLLALHVPKEHMIGLGDHPMQVLIFERGKGLRWQGTDTLYREGWSLDGSVFKDLTPCGMTDPCISGSEFPFSISDMPVECPGMSFVDVSIRGNIHWPDGSGEAHLIYAEDGPEGQQGYRSQRLFEGAFQVSYRLPPRPPGNSNKLYVWNLSGRPFSLDGFEVIATCTFQEDP